MSPRRTQFLHQRRHLAHLAPIVLVGLESSNLSAHGIVSSKRLRRLEQGFPNRSGATQPDRLQLGQRSLCLIIESD